MRSLPMFGITASLVMVVLAATASASPPPPAPPQPTLNGESLLGFTYDPAVGDPPRIHATTNCGADGSGTITFDVSGAANGPYPGTFNEKGTITLGPVVFDADFIPHSPVVDFYAEFSIDSIVGQVDGTKRFASGTNGLCRDDFFAFFSSTYSAKIKADNGVYRDTGTSGTALSAAMFEYFQSDTRDSLFILKPGKGCGDPRAHERESEC